MAVSTLPLTSPAAEGAGVLGRFHPAVRTWFSRRFKDGPTEAQAGGWPAIMERQHTLICAPTGSGKTLAGFLAAIDALYRAHERGSSIEGATQVVYVSPRLPSGRHTLRVRVTGDKSGASAGVAISIDRAEVHTN